MTPNVISLRNLFILGKKLSTLRMKILNAETALPVKSF